MKNQQTQPGGCPSKPQTLIVSLVVLVALSGCGRIDSVHSESGIEASREQLDFAGRLNQDELDRRLLKAKKVEVEGPDGEKAYRLPAPDRIAHFKLAGGRRVSFSWSPITNDVIYEEEANDGDSPLFDTSTSMLERYVTLADDDAPVPAVIVKLEDRLSEAEKARLTAGRELTMMPLDSVEVKDEYQGGLSEQLTDSPNPTAAVTSSCQSATHFADSHCYYLNHNLIAPNRHDAIWCCDENYPGACGYNPNQGNTWWYSLQRSSGAFRKNSYSRAAACSTSVRLVHWFKAWGTWFYLDNRVQIVPENMVYARFVMGGGWYHRRITYNRQSSSGGLRAYSEFSNP